MNRTTSPSLTLTTKQGITLGTVVLTGHDDPWSLGQFKPELGFELVESLFAKRREVIEQQLFTHEDMLAEAIHALGLSLNGDALHDFQLDADLTCAWKLETPAVSQAAIRPTISHPERIAG